MSYNGRYDKKGKVASYVVTAVLLLTVALLTVMIIKNNKNNTENEENTPAPHSGESPDNTHVPSDAPETPAPPTGTPAQSVTPPATEDTVTAAPPTQSQSSGYDYSQPVPTGKTVSKDSFNGDVFIGDSRLEDFGLYTGLAGKARFYTHVGLSVNQLVSDDESKLITFRVNGEKLTLEQALRKYDTFSKVYLMMGYNELGWPYTDTFVKYYVRLISMIKGINPDADIYIFCIIPVARTITGSGVDPTTENNENIAVFNSAIKKMCEDNRYYYLNVQEVLVDSEGYLPDGWASDGIHLKKEYCSIWFDYMCSHVVEHQNG